MSSEPYDFDEQLEFGNEWESEVRQKLESVLLRLSVDSIDYEENPGMQRAGIDHIISKEQPTIDVKASRYEKTKDPHLPFEVVSVMESGEPGWFLDDEKETDLIVWVYPNKAKTNLYKTGYLMPMKTGIRSWFEENFEKYDFATCKTNGQYGEYHTGMRWVYIPDIPDEYLVEFDPRLPTDKETPQSDITEWMG